MKVACICPTYGRCGDKTVLVEEAIESFLRQDYQGERELIVVNDAAEQTLLCDAPNVRIINLPNRFGTLGEKYNFAIMQSDAELILPWEDDDISLPGRISHAVSVLNGIEFGYFNPQRSWFHQVPLSISYSHPHGVCHNASAFTRKACMRVMGYPWLSGPQDAAMDAKLKGCKDVVVAPQLPNRPASWQYIYRWNVGNHLSGHHDPAKAYANWPKPKPGEYILKPRWVQEYDQLTAEICKRFSGLPPWGI